MKPTIGILSLLAIALLSIAYVNYGPAFAAQLQACQSNLYTSDQFHCLTSGSRAATIGYMLYLAGAGAVVVAWGMGLIRSLQLGRWGWFLVILLFSPLATLLFGILGPTTRVHRVRTARVTRTAHA